MKKFTVNVLLFFFGSLMLLVMFWAVVEAQNYLYPRQDRVVFLNVGQGDSILLQTAAGENILIDGGPDNTVVYRLGKYIPFYDPVIDLLVLTHPDSDHVTGLVEILRRYQVKNVLATGVRHDLPAYQAWQAEVEKYQIPVSRPENIREIKFGAWQLKVLWPREQLAGKHVSDELNDTSIVIQAIYSSSSKILLTGDLGREPELVLLGIYAADLNSQVLKFGHHGSKTSSAKEFLAQVSPHWGVVSAGADNRYGHPHLLVIAQAQALGIEILSTAVRGDIVFTLTPEINLSD